MSRPTSNVSRRRWLSASLSLLLATSQLASAAYVQVTDCYDELGDNKSPLPRSQLEGLRASLSLLDGSDARLALNLSLSSPDVTTCPSSDVFAKYSAIVDFNSLARPTTSHTPQTLNISCHEYTNPRYSRAVVRRDLNLDIHPPRFLDDLDLTIRLSDASNRTYACARGHITPSLSPLISSIALYLPITSFLLVLLVALWHEVSPLPPSRSKNLQQGPFILDPSPSHLTRIAQSLSYIQFIFFSASLSLLHPGFLRAASSKCSWSTLMIPRGPILSSSPYYGTRDGIYEVNGTLGGTAGLELMTQVLGAPVTTRTWANIASLSLILLLAMACLFQLGHRLPSFFASRRDNGGGWAASSARRLRGTTDLGLRGTAWTVLRVFLSYFLYPVTAWATYQLTMAGLLPAYHIALASLAAFLLVAALCWAVRESSPRNVGYLLLDSPKVAQTPGRLSRGRDRHASATFALLLVRGAAVGGMQTAGGMVQVLVLAGCEVLELLVMGIAWRSVPFARAGGMLAGVKLVVLGLSVTFLPGVAGREIKLAMGLAVLGIHVVVLVGVFVFPSLFRIGALLANTICSMRGSGAATRGDGLEDFRLRQLHLAPDQPATRPNSEAFDNPRPPSSLLMSPMSRTPLRKDLAWDDLGSPGSARRSRLSLSSSSDASSRDGGRVPDDSPRASEDNDEMDIGSPAHVYEARMGRRFSKASVLNYSRPLSDRH
ncbi:integral membrane protein [Colletotrichum plurivorum]|uniref:Integral membrane protein n=1 Tax=Colletotrichum plurivorum TaxID=2175906 RepID=A0A8H6KBF5_9PEZI|nr:integral membrane protein [Colletotrichum plurivorum]